MIHKYVPIEPSEVLKYKNAEHFYAKQTPSGHLQGDLPSGISIKVRSRAHEFGRVSAHQIIEILYYDSTVAYLHTGFAPAGMLRIVEQEYTEVIHEAIRTIKKHRSPFTDDTERTFARAETAARIAAKLNMQGYETIPNYVRWKYFPDWKLSEQLQAKNVPKINEELSGIGLYLVSESYQYGGYEVRTRGDEWGDDYHVIRPRHSHSSSVECLRLNTFMPGHVQHNLTLAFIHIREDGSDIRLEVSAPDVVTLVQTAITSTYNI